MKTQQEIFAAILSNQAVTDAVIALSGSCRGIEDAANAFPHYYRLCGALSDVVKDLDLSGEHAPEEAKGIAALVPFVTIGMPGIHGPFVDHWGDAYLTAQKVDRMFFTEAGAKALEHGDAGNPNYIHGLMVVTLVSEVFLQLAGTSLMMAAAMNLNEGLEKAGEFHA